MQLINLTTSPVYPSEQCFPHFLIAADKSRRKEMNTRRLCLWMSHMCTSMCKWQNVCVCLHLLPREETSAAGCQRPPVGLRPAAADPPACRTDLLSAPAKAAAGGSEWRETAVLLDRPMARHPRQRGFALFSQMKAWRVEYGRNRKSSLSAGGNRLTGLSCVLEGMKWNGVKYGKIGRNFLKNTARLTGRRLIVDNYAKTFLINNN